MKIITALFIVLSSHVVADLNFDNLFIGEWTAKSYSTRTSYSLRLRGGIGCTMPGNPDITYGAPDNQNTFLKSINGIYGFYDYNETYSFRSGAIESISNKIFIMPEDLDGHNNYIILTSESSYPVLRQKVRDNGFHSVTKKVIRIKKPYKFKANLSIKDISDSEYQKLEFYNRPVMQSIDRVRDL